ncbi:MAG: class I SAM-dependent methyltransferase [Lachnospiraceae bacterium]|nr:class I SAM-dependent methyltransferase [Lachnospiraceae bacterium]
MNKKLWDLYAPIYEKAMRGDRKAYGLMYERIPQVIQGMDVLEVATGPGLLAKHVAHAAHKMIATDYSDGMIREAKKGRCPENLRFEVADAEHLPYEDDSFDVVIIANALHIVPNPENALREISRVLKDDGLLIAPNFVNHKKRAVSVVWSKIISIAGVKLEHQWSVAEYRAFLEANGWKVVMLEEMPARITLAYAECVKQR